MKLISRLFAGALVAGSLLVLPLKAQQGMGGPGIGSDAAFLKVFENFKGFSADCEIALESKSQGTMSMTCTMDFAEKKVRTEMDLTKIKSAQMPPEAMEQVKAMGMARMCNIIYPEKKEMYMIYPDLKAYAKMPIPGAPDVKADAAVQPKVTDIGAETIEGHACIKRKVEVTLANKTQVFTIWAAKDLKEFPIKVDMNQGDSHIVMIYHNVKLDTPPASRFELPAGFNAYTSMQQMMQAEMMKRMSSQ
jgi:hypothetical protein